MNRIRIGVAALVAGAMLAVSGCGSSDEPSTGSSGEATGKPEKAQLKVGALPLADFAALYWAKDKGFFSKEGLDVTIEPVQGGPAGVQKAVSGELDLTTSTPIGTAMAVDAGLPIQSVVLTSALADNGIGIFVPQDSPIQGLKDLNGKSVGINTTKNMGDITLASLARSENVQVKPNWVEVPFPEMIGGVQAKSIDAGYMPEPFMSAARAAGLRQVVDNTAGPNKGLAGSNVVASKRFLDQNPNTAAAFSRAMYAAGADMDAKESEVRAWLPTIAKVDPAVAKDMPLPSYYSEMNKADFDKAVDILREQGLVKKDFSTDKAIWSPSS